MKFLRSSPILGANVRKQTHFLVNSIDHWKIGLFGDENGTTHTNDKYGSFKCNWKSRNKRKDKCVNQIIQTQMPSLCQHNKSFTELRARCLHSKKKKKDKLLSLLTFPFEISYIFSLLSNEIMFPLIIVH